MEFLNVCLNGLLSGFIYAQMALGLSLLYGVLRLINFAHGEMITGGMLLLCFLEKCCGLTPFITTPIIIFLFLILFLTLNKLVFQHLLKEKDTTQFIAMAALAMIILNFNLFFFKADTYSLQFAHHLSKFSFLNMTIPQGKIFAALISALSTLSLFLFLNKTLIGKTVKAVALNPKISVLLGIDIKKIFSIALIIASVLMGLSSISLLLTMDVSVQTAPEITLICFIIVILGGLGSVQGTVIAAFIIGFTESFVSYYGSSVYKSLISFIIFIIILMFKPQGIFGKKHV